MKKTVLLFTFIFCVQLQAQTYIKYNPVPNIYGVINLGVETSIGKKTTFSFDILTSPWDYKGKPRKFVFFVPEVRYHFQEKYKGFYAGGHMAYVQYYSQKWGYDYSPNYYQKGFGYLLGATVGYQLPIAKKWNLDFFIGGGWQEGYYKGYNGEGERGDGATNWNISGDWYLYRGGVMVSYKI
nr:DUF3575 domain-containing protein [uncultured Flavobacterium sp.]